MDINYRFAQQLSTVNVFSPAVSQENCQARSNDAILLPQREFNLLFVKQKKLSQNVKELLLVYNSGPLTICTICGMAIARFWMVCFAA